MADDFVQKTKIKSFSGKRSSSTMPYVYDKIHFKSYPRFKSTCFKKIIPSNEIEKLLLKRSSERAFSGRPLSLDELGKLLYFSGGVSCVRKKDFDHSRRTYPSAGARYPLEIYPIVFNVRGLKPGVYHYNVKSNSLETILEGNARNVFPCLDQSWTKKASVIILVSAVFARTTIKYHERGYRYVFLDAGHLVQNMYLASASMGLNCCSIGGFVDDGLNELLDIDGEKESVIYVVGIGKRRV